jgi:hypothetical protein
MASWIADCLTLEEKNLASGSLTLHFIPRSAPERPGVEKSDISRSGAFDRAAAKASSGEVKDIAQIAVQL